MIRRPPRSTRPDTLFPYSTLSRGGELRPRHVWLQYQRAARGVASEKRALRSFEHLQVAQVKKLAGTTLIVGDRVGRHRHRGEVRSEERRVGKECVGTCRTRGTPCH